jgi:hypothetical protein
MALPTASPLLDLEVRSSFSAENTDEPLALRDPSATRALLKSVRYQRSSYQSTASRTTVEGIGVDSRFDIDPDTFEDWADVKPGIAIVATTANSRHREKQRGEGIDDIS